MRFLLAAFAAIVLSQNAFPAENNFQETTNRALAAGEPAAVVRALEKEINRGNIVAAQQLGLMYRDGKLVTQDYAKARKLLKVAADQNGIRAFFKLGLAESQYALGSMLRDGIGGKADAAAAASWLEHAAEQGYAQAQLAVARMYIKGAGIKQNPERAFLWSSIASKLLTEAAQKESDQIRDLAEKQLAPKQLAKARNLVNDWKPKT
jgi:TPR repeat protein